MSLSPAAAAAGVITSSTGNHGLGVATAAKFLGIDAEVFLSAQVSPAKREKIRDHGARIRIVGDDPLAAELAARAAARESGRTYVSPYNDPHVVAGQGTIGVELMRQLPDLDAIFIATGGGGLISGVGSYLRHRAPQAEIIGCWPENSAVLYECLKAGRIVVAPERPTLSESTAGGVESGSITFDLCRQVMHHGVLVSEEEILRAMRWGHAQGWAMEGASGVALAAYFKESARYANRKVVVLICGGNPSPAVAELISASIVKSVDTTSISVGPGTSRARAYGFGERRRVSRPDRRAPHARARAKKSGLRAMTPVGGMFAAIMSSRI